MCNDLTGVGKGCKVFVMVLLWEEKRRECAEEPRSRRQAGSKLVADWGTRQGDSGSIYARNEMNKRERDGAWMLHGAWNLERGLGVRRG